MTCQSSICTDDPLPVWVPANAPPAAMMAESVRTPPASGRTSPAERLRAWLLSFRSDVSIGNVAVGAGTGTRVFTSLRRSELALISRGGIQVRRLEGRLQRLLSRPAPEQQQGLLRGAPT